MLESINSKFKKLGNISSKLNVKDIMMDIWILNYAVIAKLLFQLKQFV